MKNPSNRAAIYAQFGSWKQGADSNGDQVTRCRLMVEKLGYTILEDHIYVDRGKQGTKIDRKQLTALMEDAKAGKFDVVVVDDPTRLSRNLVTFLTIIEELHNHGVCMALAAKNLDTDNPKIRSMICRMNFIYDEQLAALQKTTFRGQHGEQKRG